MTLVKALLHRPEILLMDEPTTGLDPGRRASFLDTLRRIQEARGITVMMTSHIFSEAEVADRMAILQNGALLANDTPDALRSTLGHEMVVIDAMDPEIIEADEALQGQNVRRVGDQIRVEGGEGDAADLLAGLLRCHRRDIRKLSIKQPTLEDVYIHITGQDPHKEPEQEEAGA